MKKLLCSFVLLVVLSAQSYAGKYADIRISNPQDTPPGLYYATVSVRVLFAQTGSSGNLVLVNRYITGVPSTSGFVYVSGFSPSGPWYAQVYYGYREFRQLNYDDGKYYLGRCHSGPPSSSTSASDNDVDVTCRVTWRLDPNQ